MLILLSPFLPHIHRSAGDTPGVDLSWRSVTERSHGLHQTTNVAHLLPVYHFSKNPFSAHSSFSFVRYYSLQTSVSAHNFRQGRVSYVAHRSPSYPQSITQSIADLSLSLGESGFEPDCLGSFVLICVARSLAILPRNVYSSQTV
jgi:hypothetical protein